MRITSSPQKPECRVLQVFTALGVGGAETWLIALLKHFKEIEDELPVRLKFDICLTGGFKAALDDEAIALGARLFYLPYTRQKLPSFVRGFRRILRRGCYHAIHDHQDYTAGLHFLFGLGYLPSVRIAHVHNSLLHINNYSSSILGRSTLAAGRSLLEHLATHIMGTSEQILSEYKFDTAQFHSSQLGAAYCGFDVTRFRGDYRQVHSNLCQEFGWNEKAQILLFIGRLGATEKNPRLALEIARACIERNPDVRLLMAGAGDTEKVEFQSLVKSWGLQNEIRLLGVRSDVPRLMQGCDLLLFPSLAEGLGMVAVEAQAAGLRVLASDTVPRECVVMPEMVKFESLVSTTPIWSEQALQILNLPLPNAEACNLAVKNSGFSIENSAAKLLELYTGGDKITSDAQNECQIQLLMARKQKMNNLKKMLVGLLGQKSVLAAKNLFYGSRGEPIQFGPHSLRYISGTRPIRLEYSDAPDVTTRNDAKQLKFFLDRVQPGDLVLDIGGHKGQYAVLLGSLVGDKGQVVSFEPDEAAREVLLRNVALNSFGKRVKVEKIALSDSDGTHSFFSRGGDSMSSLARSGLGENATAFDVAEQVVTTMRLDDYLMRNGLGFPRWIKLDTEGAEINILRGAREVLKSGAVVVCELHPYVWNEFGVTFEELLQLVRECGRTIRYLDETQKIEDGAVYGATIIS